MGSESLQKKLDRVRRPRVQITYEVETNGALQKVSEMGDDGERAEAFARSRAGRLRGVEPGKAFTRLTSLLVRRGYDPGTARRAARVALEVEAGDD